MRKAVIFLALSLLSTSPLFAQRTMLSPEEEANKKHIHEFYRQVWETGNAELLPNFYAADFREHNPAVPPGGLDGLVQYLKRRSPIVKPMATTLRNPPSVVQVDGDLVTWIFRREMQDPRDGSTYSAYWFDTYRVRNGKVVEHWDAATRPAPPPAAAR